MRGYLIGAGVNGALGVAMGAMAAHALEETLSADAIEWVRTGASYQLWHAASLLGLAALATRHSSRLIVIAGSCFAIGALLFGGSLYLYAWVGQSWLAMVTPFGGLLLILGWLVIIGAAFRVVRMERRV